MTQWEALDHISRATGRTLTSGDIMILATSPERLQALGESIKTVHQILKDARITVIIMSDEMGLTIVPEARRAIPLAMEKP